VIIDLVCVSVLDVQADEAESGRFGIASMFKENAAGKVHISFHRRTPQGQAAT